MVPNLRTLDFQQLTSFVAVVRGGGVTAAAGQLGLAKSAVSKHVSQLEAILQVKLLERSSRRVALTREGEHLLSRMESLLAEGTRLLEQAREEHGRPEGLVRVAATPDFGALVAERFFPQVVELHPGLELVMEPAYAFADLQDPAFDLAFRVGDVNDDRLVARKLGVFQRVMVASPEYLRDRPIKTPQDLPRHQCIAFSGTTTQAEWSLVQRRDGSGVSVNVRGKLAARSFRVLVGLAEHGAGIALVPDFMVAEAIAAGRLRRCLPHYAAPAAPVFLTYRVGSDKIQRIRTVLDLALEHVPELLATRQPAARSAERHAEPAAGLSAGSVPRGRRRRSASV